MRKKTSSFLDRALFDLVLFLQNTISNESLAARQGFLQTCDPRLKMVSISVLLIAVLLSHHAIQLVALYIITLGLTVASSISLIFFLKRTLFFIPIFAGFIIIPSLFNIVTPGDPVYSFYLGNHAVSITRQGMDSALIFFMRVLTSVSLAVLLVLTTRHHVLLKSLRIFGVPQIFVMTMGMTYRYIFLFLDGIRSIYIAIKSRVGFISSSKAGRRIAAANMAGLWMRSYRLQTQIYYAMLSRGYCGEPRVLEHFKLRTRDFGVLMISLLLVAGILWLNHSLP